MSKEGKPRVKIHTYSQSIQTSWVQPKENEVNSE